MTGAQVRETGGRAEGAANGRVRGTFVPGLADWTKARVRAHRRRFARRAGVRLSDLDAITNERLLAWAQAQTRLELDAEIADAEVWWRAHNATARALRALEERVRELGLDKRGGDELSRYLESAKGNGKGGE